MVSFLTVFQRDAVRYRLLTTLQVLSNNQDAFCELTFGLKIPEIAQVEFHYKLSINFWSNSYHTLKQKNPSITFNWLKNCAV